MLKKLIAEKRELAKNYIWIFAPMENDVSWLKKYQEHLVEYRMTNIRSIENTINATSRKPIEIVVDMEDGSTGTIQTSERERALDRYEDEYYESNYIFDTFLLEGFIYKTHQQLDLIMRRLCGLVEKYAQNTFDSFASRYKKKDPDAPMLFIRGEYLQSILSPQNDPDRGKFKELVTALERISIVRNCTTHEDSAIDNYKYVPTIKQFFRDNNCGRLEENTEKKIITLNYQYPDYLIKLLEELLPFMKRKLVDWLKS